MVKKIALLMICALIVSSAHAISFHGRPKQKAQATPETSTPATSIPTPAASTPAPAASTGLQSQKAIVEPLPQPPAPALMPMGAQQTNTIPFNLLELQFDQCVEQNSVLGSRLVGSYCQCVATEYYQNLPHLGYLRFLDGLAAKEMDALKYQKQTSEFCFAAIARMMGP